MESSGDLVKAMLTRRERERARARRERARAREWMREGCRCLAGRERTAELGVSV
jgi:hypothetical protein